MMLALDQTAEAMLGTLQRENAARVAHTGMAMTGAAMRACVEMLPPGLWRAFSDRASDGRDRPDL